MALKQIIYTISVYKLLVYINLEQFCIFQNVSYNIIIMLSVLKNRLVTGIPILIMYTCTYSAYLLHEICYTGVTCIMQYISKSKLLRSVLFTISVKFVINVLPTCIFGLIGVLTVCSVKHFVVIHCYSYTVVCKNHIIYVNFSLGSINHQCDHDARVKWVKNPHTLRKQMYVTINQVFTNDWYAFVFSKPLFTLAYIQCIFICLIFITSFGKFIRFSITINLLIAIYPIVSNSVQKAKHVYNNFIWGGGR